MGRVRLLIPVLCLDKGNISSLQSILKREDESIWGFPHSFGQAVQQIDVYSMDAVLQNFKRSFGPTTLFFQSLSLDLPVTMEELYSRADKFSTLEDNIRAALQTVMITAKNNKLAAKGLSEEKSNQGKSQKRHDGQSEKKKDAPPPPPPLPNSLHSTSPMIGSYPSSGTSLTSNGPHQ